VRGVKDFNLISFPSSTKTQLKSTALARFCSPEVKSTSWPRRRALARENNDRNSCASSLRRIALDSLNDQPSIPVYTSMSSTMAVQGGPAGENIKKKHPELLH